MDTTLVQALLHPSMYVTINLTLFVCAILVLFMQPGFMLLETGSVSRKNAINNLFKNFFDLCLVGLFFWFIGFDILNGTSPLTDLLRAFGLTRTVEEGGDFITPAHEVSVFFQLVFASTAVTITSGCITGRVRPFHYILYSVVFSAVVYPLIAFMVWNPEGLLYGVFIDFAGSVVVHAVGGFAGLAGAMLLGPRIGFFRHGSEQFGAEVVDALADSHQPHNVPLAALGVFLLWIGWYGFNAGTHFAAGVPAFTELDTTNVLSSLEPIFSTFGQIIANTTLGPAAGATVVTASMLILGEELDMLAILNGAIAGLVGITAAADSATVLGALLLGAVSGFGYMATRALLDHWRIDDPVGAFPAHGVPGLIGVIGTAFFVSDNLIVGLLTQTFFGLLIVGFAFGAAYLVFLFSLSVLSLLRMFNTLRNSQPGLDGNWLRVAPEVELEGLDQYLHGRDAYNVYDNV